MFPKYLKKTFFFPSANLLLLFYEEEFNKDKNVRRFALSAIREELLKRERERERERREREIIKSVTKKCDLDKKV